MDCFGYVTALLAFVTGILYFFLVNRLKGNRPALDKNGKRISPASILAVLGSGGHTKEMITVLSEMKHHYHPRYYIIANTDSISEQKVHKLEEDLRQNGFKSQYHVFKIPRSREVRQSWLTTILSTLYSILYSFPLVFRLQPEVIICNGPGTCIPVCLAGLILKWTHLQRTTLIYIESICRVKTLSLSAKILYPFADEMLVQWPELTKDYPRAKYIGKLV